MSLFARINVTYFLIAFCVGILFVYLASPAPQAIIKFPTPYNAGKITYRDKSNTCYQYKAEKTGCPSKKSAIRPQPIIEDFKKDDKHVSFDNQVKVKLI
jgi:hypothetical protein